MSEYQLLSLGQICSLIKDGTHGTHPRQKDGIPLISAKDVQDGRITISSDTSRISREEYETIHRTYEIQKDDLLISLVGSIGRCALVTRDHGTFSAQRSVGILRSDRSRVDPKYLYHATCDYQFQQQLLSRSKSTAQAGVYLGELAQCSIPLPPLPEQKKIAEILSGMDEAMESLAEQKRKKILSCQDLLDDHFSRSLENSSIPLADVLCKSIEYGANASASPLARNGTRFLRITDIKDDGTLNESGAVGVSLTQEERCKYQVNKGDILLARTGNTVGKSYLYRELDGDLFFAGYLLRVTTDEGICLPEYLFLYTQTSIYKKWIADTCRTGAQPNINAKEYGAMLIPSKPISDQQSFVKAAMATRDSVFTIERKIQKLSYLKQALTNDLLSGRNRVSV